MNVLNQPLSLKEMVQMMNEKEMIEAIVPIEQTTTAIPFYNIERCLGGEGSLGSVENLLISPSDV